jgi:hypothetical protein
MICDAVCYSVTSELLEEYDITFEWKVNMISVGMM